MVSARAARTTPRRGEDAAERDMSGIAFVLDPRDPAGAARTVRRMLAVVPHRATRGLHVDQFEAGALGLALGATSDPRAAPFVDPARGLTFVADLRSFDPSSFARTLGLDASSSSAELIASSWARFGPELARHLPATFALVLFDHRRRRVFAARDAFGTRPLFFARDGERLLFASEVEQLVAAGVSREVDPDVVLEHLTIDHRLRDRTFFAAIRRVLPGHFLSIEPGRERHERWFHPPRREHAGTKRQIEEEVAHTFRAVVADAMERDRAVLVQLSGGLDSSSIACAAAELARRGQVCEPVTISALYPGLPCDETEFIDVVTKHTGLRSERFDGTRSSFADYARPGLLHPGPPPTSGLAGERAIIARTGAEVVLSGSGGDQLFFERGLFRDLARHGRFGALAKEALLAPRYSTRTSREIVRDALSSLVPEPVRGLRDRWRTRELVPPSWLGPELRSRWLARAAMPAEQVELSMFSSSTQALAWRWLTSAPMCWNVEVQELQAAHLGLELRFPFLDARLVELVLSVPWHERLPSGRMKALLRDALADLLPPKIRERTHVTSFETAVHHHVAAHERELRRVLEEGPWRSEPWIDRREARAAIDRLSVGDDWLRPAFVWGTAMLELFARRVERSRLTEPERG